MIFEKVKRILQQKQSSIGRLLLIDSPKENPTDIIYFVKKSTQKTIVLVIKLV